jgi:chemotaxis protein MotB
MITLLLAVFIVLYSFSVVDLKKFEEVAGALGDQFHGSIGGAGMLTGGKSILPGGAGITANPAALVNDIKRTMERELPEKLRRHLSVTCRGGKVTISMKTDTITFPLGQAALTPGVRQILDALGPSLRDTMAPLRVEGHTCNLPIDTASFPSNWELSAQRATNVMVYLIRQREIEPGRICAAGYADTRPLAPNDTAEGRRRNRRVDIVVLSGPGDHRTSAGAAVQANGGDADGGPRLSPVRLIPTIDLRDRYYQHTGRRTPDTPASDYRRER